MDYTAILEALNKASLFDLHRLQSAIYQELINPVRVEQVKAQLKVGQSISYFDPQANGLIDAVILKIQKTRCLVRNVNDQKNWNIPFYYLNLDGVDTAIQPKPHTTGIAKRRAKLSRVLGKRALKSFHPRLFNARLFAGEPWSDKNGCHTRNQAAAFC